MTQLSLSSDIMTFDTKTEGIKYTGSKAKLIPQILDITHKTGAVKILDGFAGTSRVSQAYAKNGFQVISNDRAIWSKTFGDCYLAQAHDVKLYEELISHLNTLSAKKGWFSQHYGGEANEGCSVQADGLKKPWQMKNTMKLDAIRDEIDTLSLNQTTKAVLLTSLMLALDKVDNTIGHYVSYLRDWSARSYKDLFLKLPALFHNQEVHQVTQQDVFASLKTEHYDLAYFDPPYGSNNEKMPPSRVRYASYYHLWKTICLNDKPDIFGKASRRQDSSDRISPSVFEEFRKNDDGQFLAIESIAKLIKETQAEYILLSYSSGGRATSRNLIDVLQEAGSLEEVIELDYQQNVMAGMKWSKEWLRDIEVPHREFLFLLKKR